MKQGDFEMYCEPDGAFFPMNEIAASKIALHAFEEPFGCNGDTSYGDHLFLILGITSLDALSTIKISTFSTHR